MGGRLRIAQCFTDVALGVCRMTLGQQAGKFTGRRSMNFDSSLSWKPKREKESRHQAGSHPKNRRPRRAAGVGESFGRSPAQSSEAPSPGQSGRLWVRSWALPDGAVPLPPNRRRSRAKSNLQKTSLQKRRASGLVPREVLPVGCAGNPRGTPFLRSHDLTVSRRCCRYRGGPGRGPRGRCAVPRFAGELCWKGNRKGIESGL
jgi:hypothetical protein